MSFFLQLMYQLLTLKDHKKLFIHCIHRTYFGQKFKIQFGKNHQNQNNYPNYPIMFLYSNVTQNNELEMESLSEYAHHAGLLLLGSDSPRSVCFKSNTHSLIQSSFYLPPLKISVKNCIWDTWSVWLECRHWKARKKVKRTTHNPSLNVSVSWAEKDLSLHRCLSCFGWEEDPYQ